MVRQIGVAFIREIDFRNLSAFLASQRWSYVPEKSDDSKSVFEFRRDSEDEAGVTFYFFNKVDWEYWDKVLPNSRVESNGVLTLNDSNYRVNQKTISRLLRDRYKAVFVDAELGRVLDRRDLV
jgi:hypothetical protein